MHHRYFAYLLFRHRSYPLSINHSEDMVHYCLSKSSTVFLRDQCPQQQQLPEANLSLSYLFGVRFHVQFSSSR